MTNYTTVPLNEVAEITAGQSAPQGDGCFSDRGIPFIRAGSLEALLNGKTEDDLEHIEESVAREHRLRLFPKDTVLFAKSGMSAKLGRIFRLRKPAYVVSHLAAILPKAPLESRYLQRWLEHNPPSRLIPNDSYPSIGLSAIAQLEVPLIPLAEQRRLADILDKSDAIQQKRQVAVRLSGEFLPSLFANMFGPCGNKHHLEPLNNHLTFITSGSRGWADHYVPVGKRFIRSLDVQMNRIGTDDVVFVNPPSGAEADRTRVQDGDVLVTITGSRIGRVAYVPDKFGEAYVSQHVSIVRLASSLRPRYCSMFLSLADGGQRQIAKAQYGQTKPGLSLANIREFQIPIPPVSEQDRFIEIWAQHEELAARVIRGASESNGLFNSLVQRAFQGGL